MRENDLRDASRLYRYPFRRRKPQRRVLGRVFPAHGRRFLVLLKLVSDRDIDRRRAYCHTKVFVFRPIGGFATDALWRSRFDLAFAAGREDRGLVLNDERLCRWVSVTAAVIRELLGLRV